MPYITFSKSYSSSDDGSKLTGADIGQLETDIAQVLNGGITNVNISGTAAIGEAKIAFDTVAGHTHNGTDSANVAGGNVLRADITGCKPVYVSVDTVNAESGALEINGIIYTRNTVCSTINLSTDAHWVGNTELRATSSTFYIYAYNDSGTTWNILFSDTAPAFANCGTDTEGVKLFLLSGGVWYRCIGTATTNATGSGELSATSVATYPVTSSVEIFTADGTWNKPSGATIIKVVCVGGGGGGGGRTAAGGTRSASGGGGGCRVEKIFKASELTDTVTVTVGAVAAGGTDGSNGNPGANASFGAYLVGYGGGGGLAGGAGAGTGSGGGGGGAGSVGQIGQAAASSLGGGVANAVGLTGNGFVGGGGVNGDAGKGAESGGGAGGGGISAAGTGKNGGTSVFGGGGGGAGSANNGETAGTGGAVNIYTSTGGGGGTAGTNGVSGGNGADGDTTKCGQGGGGGGFQGVDGIKGGNGGAYGGGGGGGGNGGNVSVGGDGGKGGVIVYSW